MLKLIPINYFHSVEMTEESQKNVSETLVKKTSINKKSIAENKASIVSSTMDSKTSQEISKGKEN